MGWNIDGRILRLAAFESRDSDGDGGVIEIEIGFVIVAGGPF